MTRMEKLLGGRKVEKKFIAVNRKKNGDLKGRKEMNYITVETFFEKCSLWLRGEAENIKL